MITVVKQFMVHELNTGSFNTARRVFEGLIRFIKFLNDYYPEIESFKEVREEHVGSYFRHLMITTSETSGEPLSGQSIIKSAQALKDILLKGNVKGWEVAEDVRYLNNIYHEIILSNKRVKERATKKKFAPDKSLINTIIRKAEEDLENDNLMFVQVAASILITSQTSLRINEFITLKYGCIDLLLERPVLNHLNRKLTSEDINVVKPVNELVLKAIQALENKTRDLRDSSGLPYLFITKSRSKKGSPAQLCSYSNWTKNYLHPWLNYHQLKDDEGNKLDLTSHSFRHAFATYAIQAGASIEFVAHMMGHSNIRGTQHYIETIQEDIDNKFADVFNENAIIAGKQALTIKEKLKISNPFRGKTVEQVKAIRKAMKLQILSNGFCTHHPMTSKKPCEGDGMCLGCRNFLTTPEFLSVHETRLNIVREQLAEIKEKGPYEEKMRVIETYLTGIISDLTRS